MAKINLEFDTETKSASILMDGKSIDNLSEVRLWKVDKKGVYAIDIYTRDKDENDVQYSSMISASSSLHDDIKKYFGESK